MCGCRFCKQHCILSTFALSTEPDCHLHKQRLSLEGGSHFTFNPETSHDLIITRKHVWHRTGGTDAASQQGRLVDISGVAAGNHNLTFRLYNANGWNIVVE